MRLFYTVIRVFALIAFYSQAAQSQSESKIMLQEYADLDNINPLTNNPHNSHPILQQVFGSLLSYDPQTLTLRPQLAVSRPQITKVKTGYYAGGMAISYEIRPEAVWDNGDPVTAYDYVFTLKAIFNPHVPTPIVRSHLRFIDSVYIEENPRRFTVYSKEINFLAEQATGELLLLPEYHYDPNKLLRAYPLQRLIHPADAKELISEEPLLIFWEELYALDHPKEGLPSVQGCGAYRLQDWQRKKEIILQRKKEWWGDKIPTDTSLHAYPQELHYKIIPFYDAAVLALINGDLDVLYGLKPNTFAEMQKTPEIADRFQFFSTDELAYYYVAFNMKSPKLSDKNVRLALSYLFDRNEIIDKSFANMAKSINSPINPDKPYYNTKLAEISFSVENAMAALDKAGWKDSNKDGIRDKTISGQKISLSLEYKYNKGNAFRLYIGTLLKEQALKAGVEIVLVEKEWTELLADMQARNFELSCMAWSQEPGLDDLRPFWHSSSNTPEGSNRVGFASSKADALIESIEKELDENQRINYYKQLQEVIYNENAYVFLVAPKDCIVAKKELKNIQTTVLNPGYIERYLRK